MTTSVRNILTTYNLLERVKEIEESEEFKATLKAISKRRQSALDVADNKRKELFSEIENLKIKIPHFSKEQLCEKAINQYNNFQQVKLGDGRIDNYTPATVNSDIKFLNRISLNYLRHRKTTYERVLKETLEDENENN